MLGITTLLILLISYIYSQDSVARPKVFKLRGEDYTFSCPEGYYPLEVISRADHVTLRKLMNESDVTRDVWVKVFRLKYSWLDNIKVEKSFYESHWSPDQTCGLLHLRDEVPEFDVCQLSQIGYICGPQEKDCSYVRPPEQCVNVNGEFFIYNCTKGISWEDARRACFRHKLDLGIVRGLFMNLSRRIYGANRHCKKAWIGMRKDEKWVIKSPDATQPLVNARYTNWGRGEPSSSGDCVVASFPFGDWKTVNCTQTADYVCMPATQATPVPTEDLHMRGSTPVAVTERKTPQNTTVVTPAGWTKVPSIVGIAVAVVIIIAIITKIICIRLRKVLRKKIPPRVMRARGIELIERQTSSSTENEDTTDPPRPLL